MLVVLEESAKIHMEKGAHDQAARRALVEVDVTTLRVCNTRATGDGLGQVKHPLVKNCSHREIFVNEVCDEFLVCLSKFLNCSVVRFPVDRIEILLIPSAVFVEPLDHSWFLLQLS